MTYEWIWSSRGMILTGENRRTRRKTCPSATLSTTNSTWTALGANPGLSSEMPVINSLCTVLISMPSCWEQAKRWVSTPGIMAYRTFNIRSDLHSSRSTRDGTRRSSCWKNVTDCLEAQLFIERNKIHGFWRDSGDTPWRESANAIKAQGAS
jgi:hypothetical protein